MNQEKIDTEVIKKDLLIYFNKKYSNEPVQKMQDTFIHLEKDLIEYLYKYIFTYILNPLIDDNISLIKDNYFLFKEIPSSLTISPNPQNSLEVIIGLLGEDKSRFKVNDHSLKFIGFGKVRKITILVDVRLKFDIEKIYKIANIIYSSGYNWMLEFFRSKLSEIENELSKKIYSYIRQILSGQFSQKLISQIWVAVSHKEYHAYTFDRLFIENKLSELDHDKILISESPAVLISELALTNLKYNESLSKKSVDTTNGLLRTDLRDAPYYRLNNTLYEIAEEAFYIDRKIVVCPVIFDEPYKLTLYFPAEYENDLIPVFIEHRDELVNIFRNQIKVIRKFKRHLFKIVKSNIDYQKIGEFCGGFFKALFEN